MGIGRGRGVAKSVKMRFSHVRGDESSFDQAQCFESVVFPTSVGMSLQQRATACNSDGFPHAGGDEPSGAIYDVETAAVFPTGAGIDLINESSINQREGFPHMSGDELLQSW